MKTIAQDNPIGQTIIAWLGEHHLRQTQLAALSGVPPAYLNKIVVGKRRPGLRTLRRLEKAMGLDEFALARLLPLS